MADGVKVVSRNRKAHHDYEILDVFEAGIVLMGSEIKSIRAGKANITEGFVQIKGREVWLLNVHIAVYEEAGVFGHEPLRPRKILLHKKEIVRLQVRVREKGLAIVPLQLYLKNRRAKIELGVARGKKNYDKRETLRQKDASRQVARDLKEHVR
jgi:SsrA-binding protein